MSISSRDAYYYPYRNYTIGHFNSVLGNNCMLNKYNVYNKHLIVNINKPEMEIPAFGLRYYEDTIITNHLLDGDTMTELVVPLYSNDFPIRKATFDSIIKKFFTLSFNARLVKCTDKSKNVYYGGPGLILDKDFKPLFMCTFIAEKCVENNYPRLVYTKRICRISPKVFQDKNVITKGIINKLLPTYIGEAPPSMHSRYPVEFSSSNVQIIIDDFDNFFVSPTAPSGNNLQEELNQCLVDNIDDILSMYDS